jgi:2-iminobutanoate/2-iminopropanoate deaminase
MIEHVKAGAVSHLPFSSAVVVDNLVFVSGQASVDAETGAFVSDTFEGEMRRSFENLRRVLEAADCRLDQVVSLRCYVDRQDRLEEFNRLYRELVASPYPARTTLIGVLGNDFLKFEVDAVAYRGER